MSVEIGQNFATSRSVPFDHSQSFFDLPTAHLFALSGQRRLFCSTLWYILFIVSGCSSCWSRHRWNVRICQLRSTTLLGHSASYDRLEIFTELKIFAVLGARLS